MKNENYKGQNYEMLMQKCIELARQGEGKVSPNPLVGCVVLDKDGNEISSGFHEKYGGLHAEANALKNIQDEANGGTLIVNLEPCSHFGKTPPCADLIIQKGIKRLVVAMKDPNPIVAGKGIERCRQAGIEVIENVLKKEAEVLNEVFIKNHTKKKCFVVIKTATTLDGKIATSTGDSKWITSEKAREEVQKIRNRYDAILTSSSTVIKDNPSMTCRMANGRNPVRIVLDRELKTDLASKIYENSGEKIYIFVDEAISFAKLEKVPAHIEIIKCPIYNLKLDLNFVIEQLFNNGISSVLVEAGGKLSGELLALGLVDKVYHFLAPKILADNSGLSAFSGRNIKEISNTLNFKFEYIADFNPDILIVYSV